MSKADHPYYYFSVLAKKEVVEDVLKNAENEDVRELVVDSGTSTIFCAILGKVMNNTTKQDAVKAFQAAKIKFIS